METQVQELLDRQISATYIGKDSSENGDIRRGKYSYVYSNPEYVTSGVWRDMLRNSIYRKNLVCIVFDEVRTAVSWGLDKTDEEAFRPEFARVGELRSMISNIPMLALTATTNPPVRAKIQRLLAMKTPLEIVESQYRENIIISVIKVPVQLEAAFKWIVDLMNRDQKKLYESYFLL
ncbi:bifunctional 3'-5' exonuclease/ATP-dependent helicase WRN-like [Ruditapes philippinarum]|uniref:bifunctional 3'-5' exonuclease/ATP-dependent helicase WRN-like n=1 Tax=Ruditapes philippinarum TaxID=129788 RepID=UPI00295A9DE3|nr:bifunctional 3'-5' exonuclease/ATP-dependent helicase WRN-like [Ruditapes philippinarum]